MKKARKSKSRQVKRTRAAQKQLRRRTPTVSKRQVSAPSQRRAAGLPTQGGKLLAGTLASAVAAIKAARAVFLARLPVRRSVSVAGRTASTGFLFGHVRWPPLQLPYPLSEREVLALVFAPFLLMGSIIVIEPVLRQAPSSSTSKTDWRQVTDVSVQSVPPVLSSKLLQPVPPGSESTARPAQSNSDGGPVGDALPLATAQPPAPLVAMLEVPEERASRLSSGQTRGVCEAPASLPALPVDPSAIEPDQFGSRLAEAARAQTQDFVIYNNKYRSLRYPMGDVPALFGVCSDVVVRAYRALGLDLQQLVHEASVGSGDRNIDHRRVEVLRRFFDVEGASLPVTSFAEDYLPGDIVTYYRPQNARTRSHVAIVSDVLAPSGRPMIIHNRGWGAQMEDALFVDQITGHYRYQGRRMAKRREIRYGEAGLADVEISR